MTILEIIDLFVQKRGENYLVVLPDSVHFLVEALEDDDQQVENRCRALIKKMEEVFGQSIESYFE
jgi:U3 small nucleolar RNA-associated protein 10